MVELELQIDGLGVAGDGVGRLDDGRVVFVADALPGDRVRVKLTESRKKVQYAELVEVLEPSPDRVEPLCHVLQCGGCVLVSLSRQAQARHKRTRVIETLRRVGRIDVEPLLGDVVCVGDGSAYRHRVRVQARHNGSSWQLGFHERRSRRLVPLDRCPVLWSELEGTVMQMQAALGSLPPSACIEQVQIAYSRRDGRAAARLLTRGKLAVFREDRDWIKTAAVSGIDVIGCDGRWSFGNIQLRYDHAHAESFDLRYEPGLFTQAFPEANDALVEAVMQAVRPRTDTSVLELHAGIGNFTVPIARAGAKVKAVEVNRRAAVLCQHNAEAPGVRVDVSAATDEEAMLVASDYDVVVLDPPRVGARAVAEHLGKAGPARVVYVSCDVGTLARDAAALCNGGYKITSAQTFDLFPQTPHVESMLVFER